MNKTFKLDIVSLCVGKNKKTFKFLKGLYGITVINLKLILKTKKYIFPQK